MSQITETIKAYAANRPNGWAQVRDWLAYKRYPDPVRTRTADPMTASSDDFPYTDGTWDEVVRARNWGLLTDEEYAEIVRVAADAVMSGDLRSEAPPS